MTKTMNQALTVLPDIRERILAAALAGVAPNTRRVYARHLKLFLAHVDTLDRESVAGYVETLEDAPTYNQSLSAIKRLATQAAANGWLPWDRAVAINGLPSKKLRGVRTGNWLSLDQARALVHAPSPDTLSGLRDRAVLAVLVGCGLRRDELSRLTCSQLQVREGRTMICNLLGKGSRLRTIGLPDWTRTMVYAWLNAAGIEAGYVVRSFKVDGSLNGRLSPSAIWDMVTKYSALTGVACSPHDLRRTYAKLARSHKAPLEVIQQSLGHSSLTTTQRYLGADEANAGDYFTLNP